MEQITVTRPRARTPHTCNLCVRVIQPGETYERQTNLFDGRIYTFKTCAHCQQLAALYLHEWWDDDAGYGPETVDSWEPATVTGLRHKVQWNRRWTRRDGQLYPIPETPTLETAA